MRSIASPVLAGELVICPYARGNTLTAVKLKATNDSQRIAWHRDDRVAMSPTPTISGQRLYVIGDKGQVSCLSPATGKTIWSEQLPKSRFAYSSSPVVAVGHVYITREDATTFCDKDADAFQLIATMKSKAAARSPPRCPLLA